MVESISPTTYALFPLSEIDTLVEEITTTDSADKTINKDSVRDDNEIWGFGGDSHGNRDYLNRVKKKAVEENVDTFFHLGDFGCNIREFMELFKNLTVFGLKGNHDNEKELKQIFSEYPNARLIDDEIIDYKGWKIVGKKLPKHMITNFGYKKKFRKLLEKALEYENVIVISHGGSGNGHRWRDRGHQEVIEEFTDRYEKKYGHKPWIIHAHKHKSLFKDMYDPPVLKKIPLIGRLFKKWLGKGGNFDINEFYGEVTIDSPDKGEYNVALKTGIGIFPKIEQETNPIFEILTQEYNSPLSYT